MNNSAFSDIEKLHVCSAAEFMGMKMYTQNLLTGLFSIAKSADNKPTSYAFIDAVTHINTVVGRDLLNAAAITLANVSWSSKIRDPARFAAYLKTNIALDNAIYRIHSKMEATIAKHEQSHKDFLLRQSRRDRIANHKHEDDRRVARRISCSEKSQLPVGAAGKKFTDEEVKYWMRTKNEQPPEGC
jgi:hypothetical protein